MGKNSKETRLEAPDPDRCQAEVPNGYTFMTLGGKPGHVRCPNVPVFIAVERQPGKDGVRGSMSVCARCAVKLLEQLGPDYAEFLAIEKHVRRAK